MPWAVASQSDVERREEPCIGASTTGKHSSDLIIELSRENADVDNGRLRDGLESSLRLDGPP
jgi:hypothetical protein